MPDETVQTGLSDNAASGLAYFTLIPAIIFLVVAPYNQKAEIRFHCWQSIILGIVCVVIDVVLTLIPFVGWIVLPLFALLVLIVWILCIVKAFSGQRFKIPVIGDFADKQAGA
jgi:uncharacterized membrane protein